MTDGYVPMPMTAHPHYESQADGIRSMLTSERYAIRVFEPRHLTASYAAAPAPLDAAPTDRILSVKRAAGPAPFVGDPLWQQGFYDWYAAVDDLGRHVAGGATLTITHRTARP